MTTDDAHPDGPQATTGPGLARTVARALDQSESPEDDALRLVDELRARFGWAGTLMTRGDAEGEAGRALTEDEWAAVRASRSWRKAAENWHTHGITWDSVHQALTDAGIAVDPE